MRSSWLQLLRELIHRCTLLFYRCKSLISRTIVIIHQGNPMIGARHVRHRRARWPLKTCDQPLSIHASSCSTYPDEQTLAGECDLGCPLHTHRELHIHTNHPPRLLGLPLSVVSFRFCPLLRKHRHSAESLGSAIRPQLSPFPENRATLSKNATSNVQSSSSMPSCVHIVLV